MSSSQFFYRLGFAALALFSLGAQAEQVTIAVAANFTDAMRRIAPLFEQHSGHSTRISYGSTGKLYAQIANGAPFEVFLAADLERPALAEQQGLAVPGSRFVYARGKLALWSARPDAFTDGIDYLESGAFRHLAIANPATAPYGLAAQQLLQQLGLWTSLQPRLVRGESIAQTFQFTVSGNAEAGLVAAAQVRSWNAPGSLWEVPQHYHAPIEQAAVLLKKGRNKPAANEFLTFLRSERAQQIILELGYALE